jgi:hypothetical protein
MWICITCFYVLLVTIHRIYWCSMHGVRFWVDIAALPGYWITRLLRLCDVIGVVTEFMVRWLLDRTIAAVEAGVRAIQ